MIVGFLGVLIVLRPGTGSVHPAAVYAVVAAVFYAVLSLTARKLATSESTLSLSLYLFAAPIVVAGILCVPGWQTPSPFDWLMFMVCGALGGLGIVFVTAAYQRAPVAVIVPFEYTALIWAATAGFVIWGEVPDVYTWVGAVVIIGSGLFILYRETLARPRPAAARAGFPLQEAAGGAVAVQGEVEGEGRQDRR